MPIRSAARRERSRLRPATNGRRSLTLTFTDFPFRGLVTLTTEPSGNVREAAVSSLGLNLSPLVVLRPAKPFPYHEAFSMRLFDGAVAAGRSGCTINGIPVGRGIGRVGTYVQLEAETNPTTIVLSISGADPRISFMVVAQPSSRTLLGLINLSFDLNSVIPPERVVHAGHRLWRHFGHPSHFGGNRQGTSRAA